MCLYRLQRVCTFPIIPNLEKPVMGRGQYVLILSVPFHLCRSGVPICEAYNGFDRSAEIPAVNIAIDGACSQQIRMVSREVDIGNGSRMSMQGILDRRVGIVEVQIPYKSFLVRSTDDPVGPGRERRPLHIRRRPLLLMRQMTRWRIGRVEINDMQSFGSMVGRYVRGSHFYAAGTTHEASTTSRPLGEMDAEPTVSFTRICASRSKVGLWYTLRTSWLLFRRLSIGKEAGPARGKFDGIPWLA